MTADDPETLRRLLAEARALLLDFDGPVCSIFAGLSAPTIAAELRDILAKHGAPMPPEAVADDPHLVLRHAATISHDLAHQIDAQLAAREIEASATAQPTPGGHEFIRAWHATGRPLAIVSNNAAQAVRTYLDRHDLSPYVDHTEGRDPNDPTLMKPSPHLLRQAEAWFGLPINSFVFVGDSTSDIQAGMTAGVPVFAYANKPRKLIEFPRYEPAGILTDMKTLMVHMCSS